MFDYLVYHNVNGLVAGFNSYEDAKKYCSVDNIDYLPAFNCYQIVKVVELSVKEKKENE